MQLNEMAEHEVLHTARLMMEIWDSQVGGHHLVHTMPELQAEAVRASEAIAGFHQACCRLLLQVEAPPGA